MWASEFDRFISALSQILPLDEALLTELSIVLFSRSRDFYPYQLRTESGVAGVVAVTVHNTAWSVIGVPTGRRGAVSANRRNIYHEAVHWYLTADATRRPLWFQEGIAELFSTFEVRDDQIRWGQPIKDHVEYLQFVGLQPLEEFFEQTQADAFQSTSRFYPQAWALVHYLILGGIRDGPPKLASFLAGLRESDTATAFQSAFEQDFDEFGVGLRNYVRRGRFNFVIQDVDEQSAGTQMSIGSADEAKVELALARMAIGAGNLEQALEHARRLVALGHPEGDDILATVTERLSGND
jgi:hypothetical protein